MARNSRRRSSNKISLNLSNYDPDGADFGSGEGGGFHIPEGDYQFKCESCEEKMSKNDNAMLEWQFVGVGGKAKGRRFYYYTVMDDEQKIGKTLEALGVEFEPGEFDLDIDEVVDARCMGEVYTDTYNGERRSKLRKVWPVDGEEEDEEETRPAKGKGKKARVVKVSEDEVGEMSEEELEELSDKHDLGINFAKLKTMARKKNAVIEALTENDLLG